MKAHVAPSICSGHVVIPPSKSMAHRAIICASLANGTSVIKNVAYSQDIKTTIAGMQQLGADIRMEADQVTVTGIKDFTIKNKEKKFCMHGLCDDAGGCLGGFTSRKGFFRGECP